MEEERFCELRITKRDGKIQARMVCDDEEKDVTIDEIREYLEGVFKDVKEALQNEPDEVIFEKKEKEYSIRVVKDGENVAEGKVTSDRLSQALDKVFE